MLTASASIGISCFLPDPRARVEAKKVARAGKEGNREIIITHSFSSTYIFTEDELFPAPSSNRCIFAQDAWEIIHFLPAFAGIFSEDTRVPRAVLPPTLRHTSHHVGAGSNISRKAEQGYDCAQGTRQAQNVKVGKVGEMSMVPSPAAVRKTATGIVGRPLFVCCARAHGGKCPRNNDIPRAAMDAARHDMSSTRRT